jgi:hypothetical protein
MGVPPASFVTKMKAYLISFLNVLQQNMCGELLPWLLEQLKDLEALHNSSDGFLTLFLLAGMSRLLAWQQFVGQCGNFEIKLVLR